MTEQEVQDCVWQAYLHTIRALTQVEHILTGYGGDNKTIDRQTVCVNALLHGAIEYFDNTLEEIANVKRNK